MVMFHDSIMNVWLEHFKSSEIDSVDFNSLLTDTVSAMTPGFLRSLFKEWKEVAPTKREESKKFYKLNCARWEKGFEALEFHIELCCSVGEDFISFIKESPDDNKKFRYEAIICNHAKACLISREIYCLLTNGYPDGAEARWRALHEVAVISRFILEHGEDCAERYLLHRTVEHLKIMEQFREHAKMLNQTPLSDEELVNLKPEVDILIKKYGKTFKKPYGWAYSALPPTKGSIQFKDIEKCVLLNHWRPYFTQACNHIHAGSLGLTPSRALSESQTPTLLAGQSNSGMGQPGHMTAISLMHATFPILQLVPLIDSNIYMKILMETTNNVAEAFIAGKTKYVDWNS
ncbi:DUF5677 domain-containing protein [Desulfovibrio litoralis]|uniref:Uncharacterized protein n=1 Tax=Desulfovibrio litoralis DSM 11393 TaxID=1121455 RepID=A0A1M7TAC7_9BACT|nr:DUF5677 domain-containing protein [Desulfovibrio litoralis]SHN67646.1 hypothetical protein SAMN02745728_01771 [Desulfovibrio litoralis DSM 11393]